MQLEKFFEFKEREREKDLEPIKSFYIKDDLNPKLWDNFKLETKIREDLLKIGKDFFESVELDCEVKDIVFCGSLCNYNWSEKYSDYDLHIIIDFKDVDENIELVEKLCDYAKKQWNMQHDITLKGYEVEVAIQDYDALKEAISSGRMGGVFSLMKNRWIKKPEKVEFIPDEVTIKKKATSIMDVIDEIESQVDEDKYSAFKEKITSIWKKIKKSRQSGLEEGGEYSTGNLVFKLLRRNGYVSKVMDLKKYAYEKQFESKYFSFSNGDKIIKEWYDDVLLKFFYDLEKIDEELQKSNYEGWSQYINYDHDEDNRTIIVEMGGHGYSDGYFRELKIDYSDIEYLNVEENFEDHNPYGSEEHNLITKYNSFNELINYIKELI